VKRGPLEMIIQKATELGAEYFQPIQTARTVAPKLNLDRLQAISIEASEQSGRCTIAKIHAPQKLEKILENWPNDRGLIFCDEAGDDDTQEWGGPEGRAGPMLDALKHADSSADNWAVLIGPEGGFTPVERALLRSKEFVTPVTLGPRILRADTAAIAALTLLQAARGDWRAR
ncbi:MAG: RNA methyltransferase, partial [Marinicaulis sp.]|nr:RNA methyltransferase [Marinicaulis sp.]